MVAKHFDLGWVEALVQWMKIQMVMELAPPIIIALIFPWVMNGIKKSPNIGHFILGWILWQATILPPQLLIILNESKLLLEPLLLVEGPS